MALAACGGGGASTPPPVITAQPQAATVADGQAVTLSVSTSVATGMTYQWQLNGAAIPGATAASYTTPTLSYGTSSYQYGVTVTDAGGNISSQPATIVVTPVAPTIDAQPVTASFADGSAASFGVHAKGSQPMSYQWYLNGTAIAGANTSSYTLNPASLSNSGEVFTVQISNAAGSATSQAAQLTITPVPANITTAPIAQTVLDSSTATFSVVAAGSASLSYQWQINGNNVAGATSASYSFPAVYANSGEQLSVVVTNPYGTVSSTPVALTVAPQAPMVSTAPQNYTAVTGGSATFSEAATGTVPLSYQWQTSLDNGQTWSNISGATSNSYSIANLTLANTYTQYRVAVSNVAGTVTSAAAVMKVQPNVQILAGTTGGEGFSNGTGSQVRFSNPNGVVVEANGNILVADAGNNVVRQITPAGVVSTLVGQVGTGGTTSGSASSALLSYPSALALDAAGNLYIGGTSTIQKMTPDGVVSILAGVPNTRGSTDGPAGTGLFSFIASMAVNAQGNLIVLDAGSNQTVRVVSPNGAVTTLAGTAGQLGEANGQGAAASFTSLVGLTLDTQGNIYVTDDSAIRMITPSGLVSLFAGTPGAAGFANGSLYTVTFDSPQGLTFDASGNLYVVDYEDIRKIGTNGQTSTLAGASYVQPDFDASGSAAFINTGSGLATLPNNAGLVFTEWGGAVRTVTPAGAVSTLAGQNGFGSTNINGPVSSARLSNPSAVASDSSGNLYVATGSGLQLIDIRGNVTNISLPTQIQYSISGVTVDAAGNLYLSCGCNQVYKVTSGGTVSVLAGQSNVSGSADGPGSQATFGALKGIAADSDGNVYVADMLNQTIRKIDQSGNVTTFAGSLSTTVLEADGQGTAAHFSYPWGLAIDSQGNLYVSDWGGSTIRKITPSGLVTTVGGVAFVLGVSSGTTTRFDDPSSIAIDSTGNLYIMNTGNSVIQRLSPNGLAYPVIGQPGVTALQSGAGGAVNINQSSGITVRPNGQVVFTSEQAVVGD